LPVHFPVYHAGFIPLPFACKSSIAFSLPNACLSIRNLPVQIHETQGSALLGLSFSAGAEESSGILNMCS
jgi:hypothetical protein